MSSTPSPADEVSKLHKFIRETQPLYNFIEKEYPHPNYKGEDIEHTVSPESRVSSTFNEGNYNSVLSHLYKLEATADDKEENQQKAARHLFNALIDRHKIALADCINNIQNIVDRYDSRVVSEGFPDYRQVFVPKLFEFQSFLLMGFEIDFSNLSEEIKRITARFKDELKIADGLYKLAQTRIPTLDKKKADFEAAEAREKALKEEAQAREKAQKEEADREKSENDSKKDKIAAKRWRMGFIVSLIALSVASTGLIYNVYFKDRKNIGNQPDPIVLPVSKGQANK